MGNELITGTIVDTNAPAIAAAIAAIGLASRFHTAVGDRPSRIEHALRAAVGRADVVLLTGGLGPTRDDCTRQAVAAALGRPLVRDAASARRLETLFRSRGWPVTPRQEQQTFRPRGATVLPNPLGTADGFLLGVKNRRGKKVWIAALPGVPREMKPMLHDTLLPALRRRLPRGAIVARAVLRLYGASESYAESRIEDLMNDATGARVGIRVTRGAMEVSVEADSQELLRRVVRRLRRRLGDLVFGTGSDTLEQIVVKTLRRRKMTLAVAESCTGGLVAHRITDVPGASNVFEQGAVCYSNESKEKLLGVPRALIRQHGAVSAPVALRMARGARRRAGADFALGITGVAGPGGGTKAKPVGLVYIALAGPAGGSVEEFRFGGDRKMVKERAAGTALNLLRLELTKARGLSPLSRSAV